MIEHFGENIRINTLDKLRTEELTIDDMYSSIEGFYLICEELRKIIETQQKLLSEGKIIGRCVGKMEFGHRALCRSSRLTL